MNRKEFFKTSLGAAAVALAGPSILTSCTTKKAADTGAVCNVSLQSGRGIGSSYAEQLDYCESLGVTGFEPGGRELVQEFDSLSKALEGRNVKISAICAGFDGFILADDPVQKEAFDTSMRRIVEAAGAIGSTGVIMVPAFSRQEPCKPNNQETYDYLCEQLHELGEFAVKCGTTVILEPLNRAECFYLRLVSAAAAICRDAKSEGVRCMGDFWHMKEETSDYAALMSARDYLQHIHIASRANRCTPGEDGEVDNYVDGFRALKEMGYDKYISLECGAIGDPAVVIPAAVELIKTQWEQA